MLYADLRGIDSHGVSTLTLYDEFRRSGKLTLRPQVRVVRETPVTALLDGDGGLGHLPSQRAMRLAIEKAAKCGVGVVSVRNSNHFGAAGAYAMMAPERGLIGFVTCATWRPGIVPTFGADAMLGTNPIAFAAPGKAGPPFCLDMATSTVAFNKVKLAAWHGKELRPGWAMDADGQPLTDAAAAVKSIRLTPLGGLPEMSSHKGYGLATMVEVLSTTLSGSFFAATRPQEHPDAPRHNVGHFFLALDPKAFTDEGEFESGLDSMLAALRGRGVRTKARRCWWRETRSSRNSRFARATASRFRRNCAGRCAGWARRSACRGCWTGDGPQSGQGTCVALCGIRSALPARSVAWAR